MLLQRVIVRKQSYCSLFINHYGNFFMSRYYQTFFRPQRVLAISKLSLYDLFKRNNPLLRHEKLKEKIQSVGMNIDEILLEDWRLRLCEEKLVKTLKEFGISSVLTKEIADAYEHITWADLIVPIGGEGTFLLTSKLITNNVKPMIGINPNPEETSNLTLPHRYSSDIASIFEKLFVGEYTVVMRSRIRTKMYGEDLYRRPFHIHGKNRIQGQSRIEVFFEIMNSGIIYVYSALIRRTEGEITGLQHRIRVLPWLALNEVFMGEFMAARTSTMSFQADGKTECKIRSSGMCVCTGSGSYSWYRSMNFKGKDTIRSVVSFATGKDLDDANIDEMMYKFYSKISFDPEDRRMGCIIYEMYRASLWPKPKTCPVQMLCNELKVKSRGFDAGLTIDGSISVPFNDGTTAKFEICPEDALRTLQLK